jgi:hypothetical protein
MEYSMKRLIVAQTPENHARIERIFKALRMRDGADIDSSHDRSHP